MTANELGSSIKHALYRQLGRASGRIQNHRNLDVDVLEDDTSYLVVFDVPGAETDDIQVRYIEGNVKIKVDRFRPFREEYSMCFPGRGMHLGGEADLPPDAVVDPNAGTATLSETGTLRIDIPKSSALEKRESERTAATETDAGPSARPASPTDHSSDTTASGDAPTGTVEPE
ncbi:Hsp20/alpha crystallin family protein [Natrialba sp. SSL1]|uniref:Hsp20/alpha crystallin family protein n=1 Tax=Natrialba sp. SSL1 TaxID=1869245 RepID=UPI0008F823C9|nr:Hsp20 family protein [Natrialba sp. SSL1]OIB57826.1 heat-shock protein Hsp20 [Natrialba sp. SSL1]